MAWRQQSVATAGQYLMAMPVSGLNLDLFGVISNAELAERLRAYVQQADILQVQLRRSLLTTDVRVFAQARAAVSTEIFGRQVEAALNSFYTIAGARVNVFVSESLGDALPELPGSADSLAETIKWTAAAAAVIAVAYVIVQFRR